MRPLQIEIDRRDHGAVVMLRGSATVADADAIGDVLRNLADERCAVTVVEMSDLDFIGSAGLAQIISGYLRNRHHHGKLRLANPQPTIHQELQKTRLAELLPIYTSIDEALVVE